MTVPDVNVRKNTWLIHCEYEKRAYALERNPTQVPQSVADNLFADNSGTLHRIHWYHKIWFSICDFITKGSTRAERIDGLLHAIIFTARNAEIEVRDALHPLLNLNSAQIQRILLIKPRPSCFQFVPDYRTIARTYKIAAEASQLGLPMSVEEQHILQTIAENSEQLTTQIRQKHPLAIPSYIERVIDF